MIQILVILRILMAQLHIQSTDQAVETLQKRSSSSSKQCSVALLRTGRTGIYRVSTA